MPHMSTHYQIRVYFATTLDYTQNSQSPNHTRDIEHKSDHHTTQNSSRNLHRHLYTPLMIPDWDLPVHSGWHVDQTSTCILTSACAHDVSPLASSHSQDPVFDWDYQLGILDRYEAEVETCEVDLHEAEAECGGVDPQEVGVENSDVVDLDDGEAEHDGDVDRHGNHAHWLALTLDPRHEHQSIFVVLELDHRWLDPLDHQFPWHRCSFPSSPVR